MKRLVVCAGLCALLAVPLALAAETARERVRRNSSLIYIHGITEELALTQIGSAGVPFLLELLRDPEFDRRDNVVAFLAYLADDLQTSELVEFHRNPPVENGRPEEYRARLLVAEALGRMAGRGGIHARAALNTMRADTRVRAESGMDQMLDHGLRLATGTVVDVRQSSNGSAGSDPYPVFDDGELQTEPLTYTVQSIDNDPNVDRIDITRGSAQTGPTYANHIDTNSPIDDARVDALLADVNLVIGRDDASDVACCTVLTRSGVGQVFGSNGDGLDVITTSGEISAVLNNSTARVKIVDSIQYCGGPGSNIIGCAPVGGDGMAVVRLTSLFTEGVVWAHEFGHNVGLGHNPSAGFVMSAALGNGSRRLTSGDCFRYHNPASGAHITPTAIGECHDIDNDNIVSSIDNCPFVSNPSQANSDTDSVGDSCDNCPTLENPDQADCDVDLIGDACDPSSDPPPAFAPIVFSSPVRIGWPVATVQKNVYRGSFDSQPFTLNDVLVATPAPFFQFYDTVTVPTQPNAGLYYLVTGENRCGEGP